MNEYKMNSNLMKKYWLFFKTNFQNALEYRGDLFFSSVMKIGVFSAFAVLWIRLDREGKVIDNYGLNGILFYYLISQIFNAFTTSRTAKDIRRNIHEGLLSSKLVKPVNIRLYFLCKHFARILSELMINSTLVIPGLLLAPYLFSNLNISFISVIQFVIFALLSSTFGFCLYLLVGMVAFWTKQAHGVQMMVRNGSKFFTGFYIPLDLLPLWFQNISTILPFQYMLFFPIKVLMEGVSFTESLESISIISLWIIAFIVLNYIVWKKGLKKYESVGI